MSYTFTVQSTYALSTHEVTFTKDRIQVKELASGNMVYDKLYANGIAFRCKNNDFELGTLSAPQMFTKQVNMGLRDAGLWLNPVSDANQFIGSDDIVDSGIYHIYNINQCPVLISKNSNYTDIKCPCTGTPCENACYQYGE